jgi:hypothetical protein
MDVSVDAYWFNDSGKCKAKLEELLADETVVDWRISEYSNYSGDERFRLWAVVRNDKKEEFVC